MTGESLLDATVISAGCGLLWWVFLIQPATAGVATWDTEESAEDLVARADRALYDAKEDGRDRWKIARTPTLAAAL